MNNRCSHCRVTAGLLCPGEGARGLCDRAAADDQWRAALEEGAARAVAAPSYPGTATMVGNVLAAAGRVVAAAAAGRPVRVSNAEQARRLAICEGCDQFVAADRRCLLCGCVARLKSRLATEHCPLPEPKW